MGFVDWRSRIFLMYIIYKPWLYVLYIWEEFWNVLMTWVWLIQGDPVPFWQDIKIQLLTNLPLFWFFIHMNESRTVHAKSHCKLSLKRMILDKILTEIMVMAKNFKTYDNNSCATWRTGLFSCFETHVIKATYFCYQNNITHTHTHTHAAHVSQLIICQECPNDEMFEKAPLDHTFWCLHVVLCSKCAWPMFFLHAVIWALFFSLTS